jgi:hypothetical protein
MDKRRTTVTRCKAKKPDGTRCNSSVLPGSNFCFFHDPAKAAERRGAQALGGRQNRLKTLYSRASDMKIRDCGDVVTLMSEAINQVRKGAIDPRVANAVGYLVNVVIKALEQDELETRIERLEALLGGRSQVPDLTMTGT